MPQLLRPLIVHQSPGGRGTLSIRATSDGQSLPSTLPKVAKRRLPYSINSTIFFGEEGVLINKPKKPKRKQYRKKNDQTATSHTFTLLPTRQGVLQNGSTRLAQLAHGKKAWRSVNFLAAYGSETNTTSPCHPPHAP